MGLVLVAYIVATSMLFCGSLVAWTYMGSNIVSSQMRMFLTRFAYTVMAIDLLMWFPFGLLSTTAALVCLLCNVWGMLDAALRYPLVPQGLTFFSAKFIALLACKCIYYCLGFNFTSQRYMTFITTLLFGTLWFPMAFIISAAVSDPFVPRSTSAVDIGLQAVNYVVKTVRTEIEKVDAKRRSSHVLPYAIKVDSPTSGKNADTGAQSRFRRASA